MQDMGVRAQDMDMGTRVQDMGIKSERAHCGMVKGHKGG